MNGKLLSAINTTNLDYLFKALTNLHDKSGFFNASSFSIINTLPGFRFASQITKYIFTKFPNLNIKSTIAHSGMVNLIFKCTF